MRCTRWSWNGYGACVKGQRSPCNLGGEISVHNTIGMQIAHAIGDIATQGNASIPGKRWSRRGNQFLERTTFYVLREVMERSWRGHGRTTNVTRWVDMFQSRYFIKLDIEMSVEFFSANWNNFQRVVLRQTIARLQYNDHK